MSGMNDTSGFALSERDHILQSIATLIRTPVGSRLQRRNYGSVVPRMIDQPLNPATILRLYSAVATAIQVWEPRASLTHIQLTITGQGKAILDLELLINDTIVSNAIELETP